MGRWPPRLAPGWANLARVALDQAEEAVATADGRGGARLLKIEVRQARGQLHLLWLLQPEDGELVDRLRAVRRRLASSSTRTCEVCGRHVPWRGPGRREVLCESHDAPF